MLYSAKSRPQTSSRPSLVPFFRRFIVTLSDGTTSGTLDTMT